MSRPKWLAVGKHSTNYETRSQLSPSKRQNMDQHNMQSTYQPNRLSQFIFDTQGEIDSPLYKNSEDRNLSSDGDFGEMFGKRDNNRYLLKQSSENVLMCSGGESKFPMEQIDSGQYEVMNDRQNHLPVYMKQKISHTINDEESLINNNQHNQQIQPYFQQELQAQYRISQQPQEQSMIIEQHDMQNSTNNYQNQSSSNNYPQHRSRIEQLSVHESQGGSNNNGKLNTSEEGSQIIQAVSFVEQQPYSLHEYKESHQQKDSNLYYNDNNQYILQNQVMKINYPSIISHQSSSIQVQPILFKNISSRLSYQKQDGLASSSNQYSDRSSHSHKVKINLSKQHHLQNQPQILQQSHNLVLQNDKQNIISSQSIKSQSKILTKVRYKLNQINQLNNELKVIKQTITEEVKFCQSGGRMELFLWERIKHDKLFIDLKQKLLMGMEKIVDQRISKESEIKVNNRKIRLALTQQTISLSIPCYSSTQISNSYSNYKQTEQMMMEKQEKINKLVNQLQISQLHCSSLTAEKQSLQQQLFSLQQQLIGVELQIEQRVRKQLRQLQTSLETRIRQQLKPQLQFLLTNNDKTSCYISTIDTLTKQIQDLTSKCVHYENYIMQQQPHNQSAQQPSIQKQQTQQYDQLFIQKMAQLQLRQQALTQVQKELIEMDARLKQVETQLNNQSNLLLNRQNLLLQKEDQIQKVIEQISRKQQQLYNWEHELQEQQNNINYKVTQSQIQKRLFEQQKIKFYSLKNTHSTTVNNLTPPINNIYGSEVNNNTFANPNNINKSNTNIDDHQQIIASPFFKYHHNKAQLPAATFTQSMITQPLGPSHNKTSTANNNENTSRISDKQSRQQFISQILSKHRLQTSPTNRKQQIRQKEQHKQRLTPKRQVQVKEIFSKSQAYSSTSNRPKSPILHYNPANQPHHGTQQYTSTHNIPIKDPSPINYYKHDRSAVYNHTQSTDNYNNFAKNTQKLNKNSLHYQHHSSYSSNNSNNTTNNISSNNINSRIINHKPSLYAPKNYHKHKPFNSTVSQNNKQTTLSSYTQRSFTKPTLTTCSISQKLQKLKEQIKREVRQLE